MENRQIKIGDVYQWKVPGRVKWKVLNDINPYGESWCECIESTDESYPLGSQTNFKIDKNFEFLYNIYEQHAASDTYPDGKEWRTIAACKPQAGDLVEWDSSLGHSIIKVSRFDEKRMYGFYETSPINGTNFDKERHWSLSSKNIRFRIYRRAAPKKLSEMLVNGQKQVYHPKYGNGIFCYFYHAGVLEYRPQVVFYDKEHGLQIYDSVDEWSLDKLDEKVAAPAETPAWKPKEGEMVWVKFLDAKADFRGNIDDKGFIECIEYSQSMFPVPLSEIEPYTNQDKPTIDFSNEGQWIHNGNLFVVKIESDYTESEFYGTLLFDNSPRLLGKMHGWQLCTTEQIELIEKLQSTLK